MKKNVFVILAAALAMAAALAGCGGKSKTYMDGTYTGKSDVYTSEMLGIEDEDDDDEAANGYGIATITIEGGEITDCVFTTYEENGALKDEDYGMIGGEIRNRDYYNKAQKAIQACDVYAENLVETGDIDEVDVISGATINYYNFVDAVEDALEQARE